MNARKTAGSDLALGAGVGSRLWLLRMHSFGARWQSSWRCGFVSVRCQVATREDHSLETWLWRRHGLTSHDTFLRTLPLRHAGNLPRLSNQLPEHSFLDHS